MILDTTTLSLEIILGGAVTTNQLPVSVEFSELVSGVFAAKHQDGQSNGATAVTILTAPGVGTTQRIAKHINVYQADTVNATVTVRVNNNGTFRPLVVAVLAPGQTLEWSSEGGWKVLNGGAASDTAPGIIEIAIQSEMEAGTDVLRAATLGRLHFHPGVAKCWGMAAGAGTLTTSYNVTSVTDTGTGRLGVNIATDFSSTTYAIVTAVQSVSTSLAVASVDNGGLIRNASQAAGVFEIWNYDDTATTHVAQDPQSYYWVCFGDQA